MKPGNILVLNLHRQTRNGKGTKPRTNGKKGQPGGEIQTVSEQVGLLELHLTESQVQSGRLSTLISRYLGHFHYVLIHTEADVPVPVLLHCLDHSRRSFLMLTATPGDLYHRDLLLRELQGKLKGKSRKLRTVYCREKAERHANDQLRRQDCGHSRLIHGCPPAEIANDVPDWADRFFEEDIRRLAREIGRCRVGVALSSGGARGLSHVGVLQVFEEHNIEIDVLAGCSMGAYVGAIWAYGYDGMYMEKLAREVEHRWGLFELVDPFILPRRGFLRGEKVRRRLKRSIGDVHFPELPRPFRVVATNLSTLEQVLFSSGEVVEAVHASSAIPGACAPVQLNGEWYIDGGVCDPLPVDILEDMGIERIIAVNTIPTPAYLRCSEELRRECAAMKGQKKNRLKSFLNQHLNYFAPGNILDTIFRSFHGAQIRVAEQSSRRADLVLRPLSFDGRWHDFRHPGKYIAIGRHEAEERIEDVKALISSKVIQHELKTHNTLATIA